jgi:hypothetical protein
MTRLSEPSRRPELLAAGLDFVRAVIKIPGVRQVSLIGSICTDRLRPKDIDFLVMISRDIEFDALATVGRRLKGTTQRVNRGADIFLANDRGEYIGRVCHYRECWPRRACHALHCGQVPHLNDDFEAVRIPPAIIEAPPLTVWPTVERRCRLPSDVEAFLEQLNVRSGEEPDRHAPG